MSKLKSNSSAKKRFRITATGKILRAHAFKRHNMRKRPQSMIRKARGTTVVDSTDHGRFRHLLPYGI
ncbi:MAG: 50S ribosomal protein L35 [Alphaproteobacteria bacterium]|nr:MAG: 50S ribosomal protein L35 [Alphaproteobacteria bacterium]